MSTIYPDLVQILATVDAAGIALVSLNRPEQRNAFTNEMRASLVECFQRLDADNKVKVVVLAGAPNKGNAFCAGCVVPARVRLRVARLTIDAERTCLKVILARARARTRVTFR